MLCVHISITWQPGTLPSGSFHVGETGIFLAACLLSLLISNLLLCLALEEQSGLISGFKGRILSSDLDTDALKHRSGVSESLIFEIFNDIFPSETTGFAVCSVPGVPTISIQDRLY